CRVAAAWTSDPAKGRPARPSGPFTLCLLIVSGWPCGPTSGVSERCAPVSANLVRRTIDALGRIPEDVGFGFGPMLCRRRPVRGNQIRVAGPQLLDRKVRAEHQSLASEDFNRGVVNQRDELRIVA